jgi:putative hydrolase of the HAD superfamily
MADLSHKKHLFFDFDDTLWDFQKNSSVILQQLFEEYGLQDKLSTDFGNFHNTYRTINQQLWSKYYKKEIDKHEVRNRRFHIVFQSFGYDNYEENLEITQHYLTRTPKGTFLKEGCIETLNYLKQNYTLHIITNGFKESQSVKIDGSGLRTYFSEIIISDEHNLIKPEEKIFRLAETMAKAIPSECVMIGDSLESDIEGAMKAGWEAIYYTESTSHDFKGRTISRLQDLKLLF